MLLPSIFEKNFIDSFFNDVFSSPFSFIKSNTNLMSTNVKDLGNEYLLEMELPGYEKKDINVHLANGYLTVTAEREESKEASDEKGRFIHRERYSGSCRRSFYVGDHLKEEDVMASFNNGILKLEFPKDQKSAKLEERRNIEIR